MIKETYSKILATGCKPLTLGGDHTVSYPILQAVKVIITIEINLSLWWGSERNLQTDNF